jgi:hypothetical protein
MGTGSNLAKNHEIV